MALPGRAQAKLRMESTKLSGLAALGREESPSTFPLCIVLTFVFDSWHYQAHFCKKKKNTSKYRYFHIHTRRSQISAYFPSYSPCLTRQYDRQIDNNSKAGVWFFMPAYTPVTSKLWKKTFATCCAGVPPPTAWQTADAPPFLLPALLTARVQSGKFC